MLLFISCFFNFVGNSSTITFVGTGSLKTPRMYHTATLLTNGMVLVAGGRSDSGMLSSAELYNPSNGTWVVTGSMLTNRAFHSATLLGNGKVLVAGGYNGKRLQSAELYDPVTGKWTATGNLGTARSMHLMSLLESGKVLVAGGYGISSYLRDAELYDPLAGTWTQTGNMPYINDYSGTATLLPSGIVLVAGGKNQGANAEVYDPIAGIWATTGLMITRRSGHSAVLLPTGKVLVSGGVYSTNSITYYPTNTELYDETSGSWTTSGAIVTGRANHKATVLMNGKVLLAGGVGPNEIYVPNSEIYDPILETSIVAASLITPRTQHSLILLANGKVLVVGGEDQSSAYLASAELYGCTVSFDCVGGTIPKATKTYFNASDVYGVLPSPIRTGYVFYGWWTQALGAGICVMESTLLVTNVDHSVYAKWLADPFFVGDGTIIEPFGQTNAVRRSNHHSGFVDLSIKIGEAGLLGDGQMAGVEWSVSGPGVLSFYWKVSSEAEYDYLSFYEVGLSLTNRISGTGIEWEQMNIDVVGSPNDGHTFRWEYVKDPIGDYAGEDCGWLDSVKWIPKYALDVTNGIGDGWYTNGVVVAIQAEPPLPGFKFEKWNGDTNLVEDVFAPTTHLIMTNVNTSVFASYIPLSRHTLIVLNGEGGGMWTEGQTVNVVAATDPLYMEFHSWAGDFSALLVDGTARFTSLIMPQMDGLLTATYRFSLARVAGCYGRIFNVDGTTDGVSGDPDAQSPSGTPAVKLGGTGIIPDNGFAAFETVVSGSGSILFSWKVSSESSADYLKFKVDGTQVAAISGTKGPWTQVSNRVESAGSHTLRWEYAKNGSLASSTDVGWVDDIVWIGDVQAPELNPNIITALSTNNLMALDFIGERGISYILQTNATLDAVGWGDWSMLSPVYVGETNGVHRFNIVPPMLGQEKMLYRIIGR